MAPKAKAKKERGRPAHAPTKTTRAQVEMMAAFGNTEIQIAQLLGITQPTLIKHYRDELDGGFLKANNAVAMNLWRQATKDDPRSINAAMFWLKMRAGWHEYMLPTTPKEPKLGKKEIEKENAARPDTTTDMGALMAMRERGTVQ